MKPRVHSSTFVESSSLNARIACLTFSASVITESVSIVLQVRANVVRCFEIVARLNPVWCGVRMEDAKLPMLPKESYAEVFVEKVRHTSARDAESADADRLELCDRAVFFFIFHSSISISLSQSFFNHHSLSCRRGGNPSA